MADEELGLKVKVKKLLGYQEYPSEVKERGYGYSISLVFLCSPLSDKITLDSFSSDYRFFDPLPDNTITEQKTFIEKLLT